MSSPMQPLVKIGHRPHLIDRKKYGQPRLAVYWADRSHFVKPGVWLWVFGRNVRILAVRRKEQTT